MHFKEFFEGPVKNEYNNFLKYFQQNVSKTFLNLIIIIAFLKL